MRLAVGALAAVMGFLPSGFARTTGTSAITEISATLHATIRCGSRDTCTWYWEIWPGDARGGSLKTPVRGPVRGPTGDRRVSTRIADLDPDTTYRWVLCISRNDGADYGCVGPHGRSGSTTANPPPDYSTFTTPPPVTLAERWNGVAWQRQATPNPRGAHGSSLDGVSCTSMSACTAVGLTVGPPSSALAEHWNGKKWAIQRVARPTGPQAAAVLLRGVSCSGKTVACVAVGGAGSPTVAAAERWNGVSWIAERVPTPQNVSILNGVFCPAATACVAVGNTDGQARPFSYPQAFAERVNRRTWTIQPTPSPSGAQSSRLSAVSCSASAACTAVGDFVSRSGFGGALAERWNGRSWSIQRTAPLAGRAGALSAVSCPSGTTCTAVGSRIGSDGSVPLAEQWNGRSWTLQRTPKSRGAQGFLSAVSCTSSSACMAVGYELSRAGYRQLAERWNGKSWTIEPTPALPGAQFPHLAGVSCAGRLRCIAVGSR